MDGAVRVKTQPSGPLLRALILSISGGAIFCFLIVGGWLTYAGYKFCYPDQRQDLYAYCSANGCLSQTNMLRLEVSRWAERQRYCPFKDEPDYPRPFLEPIQVAEQSHLSADHQK